MNAAISDGHWAFSDADVQLASEHILIGKAVILHSVEEIEHFLGNIFPTEIPRVLIAPFIVMLLETGFQKSRCQFGIGHAHGLNLTQARQLADVDLVLEVVLSKVDDFLSSIHVMLTIFNSVFQFLRGELPPKGEIDFRLADVHAEVAFDSLQGKAHLHIVLDIDVIEPEADTTQQRAFPALVAGDDPVIDLLDLFRGEPGADGLDDVLVITLAVETAVDGVIVNTCQ